MNRCKGCGVVLQSVSKEKIGYITKEKMGNHVFCERCFRILHYNDLKMIDLPTEDILKTVNQKGKYAFFLVDLLNINKEVLHTFQKIKIPKTLIISKIDYIPKSIKKNKIKAWLQEEYNVQEDILFLSATRNVNIHSLQNKMVMEEVKSAYLLGYTNVGKSTLVNHLKEDSQITTSYLPNTTIDYIKIPLEDGYYLMDSPGFQYQNPIYKKQEVSFIKKINPKTFLKPLTYQLKKGTSLLIEDIIRIENSSEKCNLTIYMSNLLTVKKVYEKNEYLKEQTKFTKELKKEEDIVIKGLGFINVKSNCVLHFYTKNIDWIEFRKSFFER